MCQFSEYREDNKLYCTKQNYICGHSYFCSKIGQYIHSQMASNCPIYINSEKEISEGMNRVLFADKKGNLTVEINTDFAVSIPNPYDYVPTEVNVYKDKSGNYKIKK